MWHIVKETKQPISKEFKDVKDLPYTLSYVIRRRMMIDGFNELPRDHKPPKSIFDKPSELKEWFDRIHGDKQTEFKFNVKEEDVE